MYFIYSVGRCTQYVAALLCMFQTEYIVQFFHGGLLVQSNPYIPYLQFETLYSVPHVGVQVPPYQFVQGAISAREAISEANSLRQILSWMGFSVMHCDVLAYDAFLSWVDVRALDQEYIRTLARSYQNRTVADGRIIIFTTKTKRMKSVIHWVNDFYRVSQEPSIVSMNERTCG